MDPEFAEGSFKKAVELAALRSGQKVVMEEQPAIDASLKRHAVHAGRTAAGPAAKHAAKRAAEAAYVITSALVSKKASQYCASVSKIASLPNECAAEGRTMFATVKATGRLTDWERDAQNFAVLSASKAGALAAYHATSAGTRVSLAPLARRVALAEFNKRWAVKEAEWKRLESSELARLAKNKRLFYKKASSVIQTHANAAVKKYLWSHVVTLAKARIERAALRAATREARRAATTHLASRFASAAASFLPRAVQRAAKTAIGEWKPPLH